MKRLVVVFGSPRSGTTHVANEIHELLAARGFRGGLLDEVDPAGLLRLNLRYLDAVRRRSALIRAPTANEDADRFERKMQQFAALDLAPAAIFTRVFIPDDYLVIKHPRLLESPRFRRLLRVLVHAGFDVRMIRTARDPAETLASMRRRNMYFSERSALRPYATALIDFYRRTPGVGVTVIELEDLSALEATFDTAPRLDANGVERLCAHFAPGPRTALLKAGEIAFARFRRHVLRRAAWS